MRDPEISSTVEQARELRRLCHVERREVVGELVEIHRGRVYVWPVQAETEPASFVGAIGMELWAERGWTHGRAPIRPEMLAPGTERLRLGVLATMVDLVAGSPPTGPINPTIDLRVTLLGPTPSTGAVHLVCRPVKVGRRLFLGETILHTGDVDRPFAHSITTFMNELIPGATGEGPP